MNPRVIQAELQRMSKLPGIRACAVVDSASGLVIDAAGSSDTSTATWEAAVNYWRTHFRVNSYFEHSALGAIGAVAVYHAHGMVVVVPCPRQVDVVVICLGSNKGVDWQEWQRRVRNLDRLMSDD